MQHRKQAPNDGVWGCTVLFLSARQVAIRRTAYHTKLVLMAPTTGPQPAHHLGMCAGKLDPAWAVEPLSGVGGRRVNGLLGTLDPGPWMDLGVIAGYSWI